ncbi:MAG: amino-acid N-acetyltransferase [Pseudohongiellaceae bacterium]
MDMVEWFRASAAYINAHRGKTFVVLLSGEALQDDNFDNIIYDLSLLRSLGVRLVLVHGSRPQITASLEAAGLVSEYHRDLRITPAASLERIKPVVAGLSVELEARFTMGLSNSPMHGADIRLVRGNFVTAKPVGVHNGVDYQYTGKVRRIHHQAIQKQLAEDNLVLLSNLGYSVTGEVFNLSAEEIATEAAIALGAEKLILLVPTAGVINSEGELVTALSEADARAFRDTLAEASDADSQCISHALGAALHAYSNGVHRSHLISFRENGALLKELFTRLGHGSLLSKDSFDLLRPASVTDVPGIIHLIEPLEAAGTLVERSRERLENEIDNFQVIELEGSIVACAALYPITEAAGELACIAIDPGFQRHQLGGRLLASLENLARRRGLSELFVLTTVAAHWFLERGFSESSPAALPEQRQRLYNLQRNSKVFVKKLG